MDERIYLTVAEVIAMHQQLIEEFGGADGIRNAGSLEAAVFRPQIGYYNSLAEEAAALMESLANNHAFVDGNKRISFAAADTFLRGNGYYLEVEPREAHQFIIGALARSTFRFARIRDWIEANLKTLPD
ncbi:MAG: type II toxin-antitoxin system death-on-curing family toxin [Terriglobales bacterium]